MLPILITGMNSTTAISVAKGLRRQQTLPVKIIGVDINQQNQIAGSSFCDSYYKIPRADHPSYVDTLLQIVKEEGIKAVFPIVDLELGIIAKHRDAFRVAGAKTWVSEASVIETCNDKYKTFHFFKGNGFRTPESWTPDNLPARLGYPLIVKPRGGISSIDVFKVENDFELKTAIQKVKSPIIQQYLEGEEFTIDVICNEASEVIATVPRLRIETKAGISTKGRTVKHPGMSTLAGEIAARLGIIGPCNVQCRIKDNVPSFFEVNPRFSGTTPLTIAAGVNGPLIYSLLSAGLPIEKQYPFKENLFMSRYWEEVFYQE